MQGLGLLFEDLLALRLILFLGDEALVSHLGKFPEMNIERKLVVGLPSGFVEESRGKAND